MPTVDLLMCAEPGGVFEVGDIIEVHPQPRSPASMLNPRFRVVRVRDLSPEELNQFMGPDIPGLGQKPTRRRIWSFEGIDSVEQTNNDADLELDVEPFKARMRRK